jgi:hypothetical protein
VVIQQVQGTEFLQDRLDARSGKAQMAQFRSNLRLAARAIAEKLKGALERFLCGSFPPGCHQPSAVSQAPLRFRSPLIFFPLHADG